MSKRLKKKKQNYGIIPDTTYSKFEPRQLITIHWEALKSFLFLDQQLSHTEVSRFHILYGYLVKEHNIMELYPMKFPDFILHIKNQYQQIKASKEEING